MTWLASIAVAVLTGALGLFTAGFVMSRYVVWYRFSSMEGASGYAVVVVALWGAGAGLVIGLVVSRLVPDGTPLAFLKGLGYAAGTVLAIAGIWAAGARLLAPPPRPYDPTPSEEVLRLRAEQEQFDAIAPDAPVAEWLPWTRGTATDEQRQTALERIGARAALADELGALMVSDDARSAEPALRLVEQFPRPALVAPVTEAGRDIAARLRRVNALPPGRPATDRAIEDVARRFGGWVTAARALRNHCDGDFTPELVEILKLSRVRGEQPTMRVHVLRTASACAKSWAGIQPLPTDPEQ